MGKSLAGILAKMGPVFAIIITILVVAGFGLDKQGVKIVGDVPSGLPGIALPPFDLSLMESIGNTCIVDCNCCIRRIYISGSNTCL